MEQVAAAFVQEHDAVLLAVPFSAAGDGQLAVAHRERLVHAVRRHCVRSLLAVGEAGLKDALARSCTVELGYRLMEPEEIALSGLGGEGVLLTCSPHAHLALANFLERDALFTVEMIGRVSARTPGR